METPAPMDPARYALLTGRTFEAVTADLAGGQLASVRLNGGALVVATEAVEAVFAQKAREGAAIAPAEVRETSTRAPMLPQEYAVLAGRAHEAVVDDLSSGRLASVRLDGGTLLVAGGAVDELLHRQAVARGV